MHTQATRCKTQAENDPKPPVTTLTVFILPILSTPATDWSMASEEGGEVSMQTGG